MRLGELISLCEMAKPRDVDLKRIYYHGTTSSVAGENIIKEGGIKPKDIVSKKNQSMMAPKPGMVYITQNLDLALTHMIGFLFGENMFDYLKDSIPRWGRYGYLFEIDASQLESIYPDEDQIGKILDGCLNGKNDKFPWLVSLAYKHLTPTTIDKIKNHRYASYAQGGKKLMGKMTDEQVHQLLDEPNSNIAHRGLVKPLHAWKFDKLLYNEIKGDGTKFFKFAEKVM